MGVGEILEEKMGETLLSASKIVLIGFQIDDLKIQKNSANDPAKASGNNHFLADQLNNGANAGFARIYGYSYAGKYCELEVPTILLVHGAGKKLDNKTAASTAMAAQDFNFSSDLRTWNYDQADFSIRLDMSSGPLSQLLLDPEGDGGGGVAVSGARVSGARVSGARVSGARVSGARVSGARLSGGNKD